MAIFLVATMAGLYFATQSGWAWPTSVRRPWPEAVLVNLIHYWTWMFAVPLIVALARRYRVGARPMIVHIFAGALLTVAQIATASCILMLIGFRHPDAALPYVAWAIRANFHSSYPTYWLILLAFYAWDYLRESRAQAVRAAEIAERAARAELDALRAQLDPHFLFNTLNSISSLMYTDIDAADRMMTRLGELLRIAMERNAEQEVPLREELAIASRYVEIEKIRFEERLTVDFDIAPDALDVRVPPLLLQPLVENAIRHGISKRPDGGRLAVRARLENGTLNIRVTDDGISILADRERVGLGNTRARLRTLYGDAASLRLARADDHGTVAEIILPQRRARA
ncbi:MAG: histidine kinase [Acidobacteriota bacterium]|nr:histidine kinase [Acidobacteriota bacterium]